MPQELGRRWSTRIRVVIARVLSLVSGRRQDLDLRQELESHVALLTEEHERRGLPHESARRAALTRLGGEMQVLDAQREQRGLPRLESFLQDVRYGLRMLRKAPGFTAVALATLALGIGANTAMFSIVDSVLLRPLAYPAGDRLVQLTTDNVARGLLGLNVSLTRVALFSTQARTFEAMGGSWPTAANLLVDATPESIPAAHAMDAFFDVLGVTPAIGRVFSTAEETDGGPDVALLSDSLWHRRFGGDRAVVGGTISLDGRPTVVIGVMPATFDFPFTAPPPDVWLPRVADNPALDVSRIQSGASYLAVYGRLRPGQTTATAERELNLLGIRYRELNPSYADSGPDYQQRVTWLKDSLVGQTRTSLAVLLAAVGLVLLIGTANLASLVLARAASRRRELAIRGALGGTRRRVLRQLLIENLTLTGLGGALGVALAYVTLPIVQYLPVGTLPRVTSVHLDSLVLMVSVGVSATIGVIFGWLPALQSSPADLQQELREASRGSSEGNRGGRVRRALVVAEVAIALVLISSAGLLMKSFSRLMQVNPGFDSGHVMTFSLSLPPARYPTPAGQAEFYRRLVENVASAPGVESAAVNTYLPIGGGVRFVYVCPDGMVCGGVGKDPVVALRQITPDYFKTMRMAVAKGRGFDSHDTAASAGVAILSETAATAFFGAGNPIGRRVVLTRGNIPCEVVGIVPSVHFVSLDAAPLAEIYVPMAQVPGPLASLLVRSAQSDAAVVSTVRDAIRPVDAGVPLANIQPMADIVSSSVAQSRLTTEITAAFAGLALLLAAIGTYGVMAYSVSRRRQEMAIRLALGATPGAVLRMVTLQGVRLVLTGIGLGLVASLGAVRFLSTILFQVHAWDPATMATVTGLLLVVAVIACYVPARRATRVNPVSALRAD